MDVNAVKSNLSIPFAQLPVINPKPQPAVHKQLYPHKPKLRLPKHEIIRRGHVDHAILFHENLLRNLFRLEERYILTTSAHLIFSKTQSDIQPWMRKKVATWMYEVCEELVMEQEVYGVAVNIMDRILGKIEFSREHFQLLASACILIASKLKETLPITSEKVVMYTENSITFESLIQMERLILSQLIWDVSSPTLVEFVDILCQRSCCGLVDKTLTDTPNKRSFSREDMRHSSRRDERLLDKIKQLAQHISQQIYQEHIFIGQRMTVIAAACIILASRSILADRIQRCPTGSPPWNQAQLELILQTVCRYYIDTSSTIPLTRQLSVNQVIEILLQINAQGTFSDLDQMHQMDEMDQDVSPHKPENPPSPEKEKFSENEMNFQENELNELHHSLFSEKNSIHSSNAIAISPLHPDTHMNMTQSRKPSLYKSSIEISENRMSLNRGNASFHGNQLLTDQGSTSGDSTPPLSLASSV